MWAASKGLLLLLLTIVGHAFVVQQTNADRDASIRLYASNRTPKPYYRVQKKYDILTEEYSSPSPISSIPPASAISTTKPAIPITATAANLVDISLTKMEPISSPLTQDQQAEEEIIAVGCISHHEALDLLLLRDDLGRWAGRGGKKNFFYHDGVSLDLGRSDTMVMVDHHGINLPIKKGRSRVPALVVTWDELEEIVTESQKGEVIAFKSASGLNVQMHPHIDPL